MTARQKGWALSPQSFEKLLLLLDADRDKAGAKYESIRARLLRIFEWRGCGSPESLADETMDRVSRRLEGGETVLAEDPAVYFYGVARNVLKEYWTEQQKEAKARQAGFLVRDAPVEDLQDAEMNERLECLDRCLSKLAHESLELIMRYYRLEKGDKIADRMELANALGVTPGTLRIRVHRIRRTLETCVNECMKSRSDG